MVHYRRNLVPGGTFFFTVTLADRTSTLLVDAIPLLRAAFRKARQSKPFAIDAIVVLPDHLHAIMTLPDGDADFPGRWKAIKSAFSHSVAATDRSIVQDRSGGYRIWQRRYWEHTVRDASDFERCANYIHFNPVKHGWAAAPSAWPYHRFTAMCAKVCCRRIGAATKTMIAKVLANAPTDPGLRYASSGLRRSRDPAPRRGRTTT